MGGGGKLGTEGRAAAIGPCENSGDGWGWLGCISSGLDSPPGTWLCSHADKTTVDSDLPSWDDHSVTMLWCPVGSPVPRRELQCRLQAHPWTLSIPCV